MQSHAILAPSKRDARTLVEVLDGMGYHARTFVKHTRGGKRNVVLTIAPLRQVEKACMRASFGAL